MMIGTSNTTWERVAGMWSEWNVQDEVVQRDTEPKKREAASLKRTEIGNDLQDWLVGSSTSQDVLRATYLLMSDLDRKRFEKMWTTVLNPKDHDVEDFKALCFPQQLERTVRDQKRAIADKDAVVASQKETIASAQAEAKRYRDDLTETIAQRDAAKENARKQVSRANDLGLELSQTQTALGETRVEVDRLQAQITALKVACWDLTTERDEALTKLSKERRDREAASVDRAEQMNDRSLRDFQLVNCDGCQFADKAAVGLGAGHPCCQFPGQVGTTKDGTLCSTRHARDEAFASAHPLY